jgi:hypothetical protein
MVDAPNSDEVDDKTGCLLEKGLYIVLPQSKVVYLFENDIEDGEDPQTKQAWVERRYTYMALDDGTVAKLNNDLLQKSGLTFLRLGGGDEEAFQCVARKLADERDELFNKANLLDKVVRDMQGPEEEPSRIIVPG